ncbi:hypothetical protein GCM10025866_19030 [Naasia aerilata]|uniref:AAA+ ATPase domain-containing protein n=1 Tax=Naasia aerilata TaxID=1162966 RepID=A0ABM8GCL7_9MICO|nr:hypothetical protein GCM10025866_19030 [Naasia aerilata]
MTDELRQSLRDVRTEVGKAVVGQEGAVTGLIIALLARGHVLLEGVPGVAKTLLVRTLSQTLQLDTKRVQFTPDLMPGDVTGSMIYEAGAFVFRPGPVFTNILLADEINRTPPKTQSALLEAMEERQVSVDGQTKALPTPFLVAATMNPIEYEGTYTLPEAQLDRFLLKLVLEIPPRDTEFEVLRRHSAGFNPRDLAAAGVRAVLAPDDLARAQEAVRAVGASEDVLGYTVDLARATRSSPRSSWASRLAARRRCSPRRRRGPGCRASKASRPTTCRRWRSPCCATASSSAPRPSSRASRSTRSSARSSLRSRSPSDARLLCSPPPRSPDRITETSRARDPDRLGQVAAPRNLRDSVGHPWDAGSLMAVTGRFVLLVLLGELPVLALSVSSGAGAGPCSSGSCS